MFVEQKTIMKLLASLAVIGSLLALTFIFREALSLDAGRGTGVHWNQLYDKNSDKKRKQAFDFALTVLSWPQSLHEGKVLSLGSLKGSAVMMNFWASWCESCAEEAPLLEQAWRSYKDKGLVVLGVVSLDDPQAALAEGVKNGKTYPLVYDSRGRIAVDYGLLGVPQTVFIDSTGSIAQALARPLGAADIVRGIEAILPSSSEDKPQIQPTKTSL
ncbi:MAG: TlpA disulfide reductase family protein [Proteobacteria bacterium]|nr:TlpA disulfide reductase family protein [Pseudomonadota bacterium]